MTTIWGATLTAAALAIMTLLVLPPTRADDRPQNACDASCRLASNSIVQSNREVKVVSDKRVTTYDIYLLAWSAMADEERRRLLRESVTEDIVFTNPMQTCVGLDGLVAHLEGFQQRSPNGKFVSLAILGWENHALATWQFVDADGKPGFTGYDVLAFDDQGRIASILLFSNVDKQKLK